MNRESVITNMEVSDADVVKAAERRSDSSRTRPRAKRSRGFPGEDDEQEDPVQGLRRRLVTRVANSDRGHDAGVLDAGVSASMVLKDGARPQRQTATIPKEHASNDVRSQDADQCEESDARYLLSLTFVDCQSFSED